MKSFLTIILFAFISSCHNNKCVIGNIKISETLANAPKNEKIDYCSLVEKAINNDTIALQRLCKLDILDECRDEHGDVLVRLVNKIGEDKIIQIVGHQEVWVKWNLKEYLDLGLRYGNNKFKGEEL